MNRMKKTLCMLLALTVLWGVLPAGLNPLELPARAVDSNAKAIAVYNSASATEYTTISWDDFVALEFSETTGKYFHLIEDIVIGSSKELTAMERFEGRFFGYEKDDKTKQHFLYVDNCSLGTYAFGQRAAIGLICGELGYGQGTGRSGHLERIIVKVKGRLTIRGCQSMGGLVGVVNQGSTINECAVIAEDSSARIEMGVNEWAKIWEKTLSWGVSGGGIAGVLNSIDPNNPGGSIQRCYVDVKVHVATGTNRMNVGLTEYYNPVSAGGIVGLVMDYKATQGTVFGCAYYGDQVATFTPYPGKSVGFQVQETFLPRVHPLRNTPENYTIANSGGIVGSRIGQNSHINKCVVQCPSIKNFDISLGDNGAAGQDIQGFTDYMSQIKPERDVSFASQTKQGSTGTIAGDANLGYSNCYGEAGNHGQFIYNSVTGPLDSAETLGSDWVNTDGGVPNLKFLVASPGEVTVTSTDQELSVAIGPSVLDTVVSDFQFQVRVPIMGTMPQPLQPTVKMEESGDGTLTSVEIAPETGDGAKAYYEGGDYVFRVKLVGLATTSGYNVEWLPPSKSTNAQEAIPGASMTDGILKLPYGYDGPAYLNFNLSGPDNNKKLYTFKLPTNIKACKVAIREPSGAVKAGEKVALQAVLTGSEKFGTNPKVEWSVPSGQTVATIDAATGILSANSDGTVGVTVKVTPDGSTEVYTATREITVDAADTPVQQTIPGTLTTAGSSKPFTATAGEKVTLQVAAPDGTLTGVELSSTAWSATAGTLKSNTGASVEYTMPGTGTGTVTAEFKYTPEGGEEQTYTATFNYTVDTPSTPPDPTAEDPDTGGCTGGDETRNPDLPTLYVENTTGRTKFYYVEFPKHELSGFSDDLRKDYDYEFLDNKVEVTSGTPQTKIGFKLKDPATAPDQVTLRVRTKGDDVQYWQSEPIDYTITLDPIVVNSDAPPQTGVAPTTMTSLIVTYEEDTDGSKKMNLLPTGDAAWKKIWTERPYRTSESSTAPPTAKYIAKGSVEILDVTATKNPIGTAKNPRNFVYSRSAVGSLPGSTPMPVIRPLAGEKIDESLGIIIVPSEGSPDTTRLFYTTSTKADEPAPNPYLNGDEPGGLTKEFTMASMESGPVIPFPPSENGKEPYIEVKAIAKAQGSSVSTVTSKVYRNTDLPAVTALTLRLDGNVYDPGLVYRAGAQISFDHPQIKDGFVKFTTVGNLPPSESNGDTYRDGDATLKGLPDDMNTVVIRAIFYNTKTLLQSEMLTATVNMRQKLSGPGATEPDGSNVSKGQKLYLTLSNSTLNQIKTVHSGVRTQRVTYVAPTTTGGEGSFLDENDKPINTENDPTLTDKIGEIEIPPEEGGTQIKSVYNIVKSGGEPIPGISYINIVVDEEAETGFTLPGMSYGLKVGDAQDLKPDTPYTYAVRMVRMGRQTASTEQDENLNDITVYRRTYTYSYQNPRELTLDGDEGAKITVKAKLTAPAGSAAFDDSSEQTFVYTVNSKAKAPTAFPPANATEPADIRPDETVNLSSETAGSKIYYTIDNTRPIPDAVQPGSPGTADTRGTFLYDETGGIRVPDGVTTFLRIRAMTVADGHDPSDVAYFIYQLPAKVHPVLATPNSGDVVEGTQVTLSTTTEGAVIYYTTDNTLPVVGKSSVYANPIPITEDTTIQALAEKEGMTSEIANYKFDVASKLKAPKASLDSGSVVYKGARVELSAKEDIAYTVDGSDPTVILKTEDSSSSGSGSGSGNTTITVTTGDKKEDQVLYGDSVVIDADFGKSVTVRAFCYGNGYTPSDVASFTYTVCEEDAYLTAVPETGSTVKPGSQIVLSTALTDGDIRYTVESSGQTAQSWDSYYNSSNTITVEGEPGSSFTIRASVDQDGADEGPVKIFTYKITERTPAPTASIPSGAVTLDGAAVALTVKEGDIFYTTDGNDPTTSSTLYSGPVAVTGSMVLKAIAVAEGKEPSEIVQYVYTHAGQAAAPVMSVPGGEIEQGTRVELKTETLGAVIYYTTDGTEPTEQSMTYTAPVTVMRPVTIKAKAALEGLHESVVNSATYTVFEPEKPKEETEEEKLQRLETDRLSTRRTYSDDTAGPSFTEVVLVDTQYNAVLSAPEGSAPKDARLVIRQMEPTAQDRQAVANQTGYAIIAAFDVRLERGGEEIELTGEAELGLPIPTDYQNGVVTICKLADDGTVEPLETRRSGGVAYAMRDQLSRYAITVPQAAEAMSTGRMLMPWIIGGGLVGLGAWAIFLTLYLRKRRRSKKETTAG